MGRLGWKAVISQADLIASRNYLQSVIEDCLPLDSRDARHERLAQAIDGHIRMHLAAYSMNNQPAFGGSK